MSDRERTDYIVIHCAATRPSMDIGAAEIDEWHKARGWKGIGYHWVISRDGRIERGRDQDAIGAHVEGFNSVSIGICMVGGVSEQDHQVAENNFTAKQWESLKEVVTSMRSIYPDAVIQGHRDFPGVSKSCPSFDAIEWAKTNGFAESGVPTTGVKLVRAVVPSRWPGSPTKGKTLRKGQTVNVVRHETYPIRYAVIKDDDGVDWFIPEKELI